MDSSILFSRHLNYSKDIFSYHKLGDASGIQWVEPRNATKHLTMHKSPLRQNIITAGGGNSGLTLPGPLTLLHKLMVRSSTILESDSKSATLYAWISSGSVAIIFNSTSSAFLIPQKKDIYKLKALLGKKIMEANILQATLIQSMLTRTKILFFSIIK